MPELVIPNPAVISFPWRLRRSRSASSCTVGERTSTETLIEFEQPQIRSNSTPSDPRCDCANRALWGRGDVVPFIGLTWRAEEELKDADSYVLFFGRPRTEV